MTLKEKREEILKIKEEKRRIKQIDEIIFLLNNEYENRYSDNIFVDNRIFISNQKYAEIMHDVLKYYKDKNQNICEAIIKIIAEFGYISKRRSGTSFIKVIQLAIPEEIQQKLEMLETKLNKDIANDLTNLANKIEELSK